MRPEVTRVIDSACLFGFGGGSRGRPRAQRCLPGRGRGRTVLIIDAGTIACLGMQLSQDTLGSATPSTSPVSSSNLKLTTNKSAPRLFIPFSLLTP